VLRIQQLLAKEQQQAARIEQLQEQLQQQSAYAQQLEQRLQADSSLAPAAAALPPSATPIAEALPRSATAIVAAPISALAASSACPNDPEQHARQLQDPDGVTPLHHPPAPKHQQHHMPQVPQRWWAAK